MVDLQVIHSNHALKQMDMCVTWVKINCQKSISCEEK